MTGRETFWNIIMANRDNLIYFFLVVIAVIAYTIKSNIDRKEQDRKWEADAPVRNAQVKKDMLKRQVEEEKQKAFIELKKLIESKAMNEVLDYEKNSYRTPVDVSADNVGYDIKSSNSNETRFIEVKGKSEIGDILITNNEWNKAKELENNYYLYVVYNCTTNNPTLYIVQNPANKLNSVFNSSENKYILKKEEIVKNMR